MYLLKLIESNALIEKKKLAIKVFEHKKGQNLPYKLTD